MTPVLADRQLECYDILAIQEPAKRKGIDDVICPGQCSWQAARGEVLGRTCFYINKRIAQARRSLHTYDILDILSLRLQLDDGILWIHNVYNPSPDASPSADRRRTLRVFPETLAKEGRHILLKDFNLYYPL